MKLEKINDVVVGKEKDIKRLVKQMEQKGIHVKCQHEIPQNIRNDYNAAFIGVCHLDSGYFVYSASEVYTNIIYATEQSKKLLHDTNKLHETIKKKLFNNWQYQLYNKYCDFKKC